MLDNDSVDSNNENGNMDCSNKGCSNKESTTNHNTNYNNKKGSSMMDNNADNRKRILQTLRKDNPIQHKRLYSNHRHHRRSNNRSCLRDNHVQMRFCSCRRNIFLCLCKPRRWCRSRFLFFRKSVQPLAFVLNFHYNTFDSRIVNYCLCLKL